MRALPVAPWSNLGHPGWPQVLRYRRRRGWAVRRVPVYRERWAPHGSGRRPGADVAELAERAWAFLPLGTDSTSLPPGPPSSEGLVAAVALTGRLRPGTIVVECRADWRPPGRGGARRDVRVFTLLDADAPGDPDRVAALRGRTWSAIGRSPVVLVGSSEQLRWAVDAGGPTVERARTIERLDVQSLAADGGGSGSAVVHVAELGYLAGRVPECQRMHVDWRRVHVRDASTGLDVTVLRGAGPVRLDVHVCGPALDACPQHLGPVLGGR